MAPAHTTEAVTVGSLLGGKRLFGVPLYQREYAWTWREAHQILEDLLSEHEAMSGLAGVDRSYYLGLIIVIDSTGPQRGAMARFRRGGQAPSEVVDGKQRLTTLTMLIAVLRDLLGNDGQWLQAYLTESGKSRTWPKDTPRLLLEEHEQEFLATHVLPAGATQRKLPRDLAHESARRMGSVRDLLSAQLKKRAPDLLVSLARMLVERCELTVIVPRDIASGYRMFVTVNFRGKSLSTNDIVKAELIGGMDQPGRRTTSNRWASLRNRLETPPDDPDLAKHAASLDNLLSHIHKLRCRPSTTIFQGIGELAASAPSPVAFIADTLEPLGDVMLAVKRSSHAGSPQSADINRILTTLNWLASNDWVPVAMSVLHENLRVPPKAMQGLALLQRLAFALAIMGRGSEIRDARYRQAIHAIGQSADLARADGPFALDEEEQEAVARLVTSNLYRTKGNYCKAVLAWISAIDGQSEMPANLKPWTIEHVLPRTPTDDPYWRRNFPDPKVRDAAIRSLGNLVLVTAAQNRRVKNRAYPEKRAIYFEGNTQSPFDTTRMLADIADWTPEAILERETQMYARVARAWGLRPGYRSKLLALIKS
ncbi:MAG: DUF262 domain-containing HNH endonuclease family protein [Hyphomicrobiaceae bacterium]